MNYEDYTPMQEGKEYILFQCGMKNLADIGLMLWNKVSMRHPERI